MLLCRTSVRDESELETFCQCIIPFVHHIQAQKDGITETEGNT